MYQKLPNNPITGTEAHCIKRLFDGSVIPFDPANTDYVNFKAQILADEAQLEDVDGNVMSPEAAKDYVRTLP